MTHAAANHLFFIDTKTGKHICSCGLDLQDWIKQTEVKS